MPDKPDDGIRGAEAVDLITDPDAAGALHDFNNAVQVAVASLRRLERRVARGEASEVPALVSAIIDQVARIGSLGAAMAGTAPDDMPATHAPIPVGPFLRAMAQQAAALIDDHIRLEVTVASETGDVACDPARLESAIRNLVLNARDAMPDGGVLTLRGQPVEPCDAPLLDGGSPAARFTAITVADTGHGMDTELLRRCFEPFVTTKATRGGTGLGLFQLRAFATEMGGTIRMQSREGQGTEATILLPCTGPETA